MMAALSLLGETETRVSAPRLLMMSLEKKDLIITRPCYWSHMTRRRATS